MDVSNDSMEICENSGLSSHEILRQFVFPDADSLRDMRPRKKREMAEKLLISLGPVGQKDALFRQLVYTHFGIKDSYYNESQNDFIDSLDYFKAERDAMSKEDKLEYKHSTGIDLEAMDVEDELIKSKLNQKQSIRNSKRTKSIK